MLELPPPPRVLLSGQSPHPTRKKPFLITDPTTQLPSQMTCRLFTQLWCPQSLQVWWQPSACCVWSCVKQQLLFWKRSLSVGTLWVAPESLGTCGGIAPSSQLGRSPDPDAKSP